MNMIMTTTSSHRLSSFILCCAAALVLIGGASPLHAQTVAVMVNGEPITNYDIEQRSKLTFLTTHKAADRQQVISELIDEKVKIREGKKFGVDPSGSDVDQSFAAMSSWMRITPEQLAKSLDSSFLDDVVGHHNLHIYHKRHHIDGIRDTCYSTPGFSTKGIG